MSGKQEGIPENFRIADDLTEKTVIIITEGENGK